MKRAKPINLQLTTIRFPLPAIISILHRISGVIVFLFIPLFLGLLQQSLSSPQSYATLQTCLAHPVVKIIIFGLLAALIYHFVAGIRHLLMDAGIGETRDSMRFSAKMVLLITAVLVILMIGVALW